jgi:hypothetical protein
MIFSGVGSKLGRASRTKRALASLVLIGAGFAAAFFAFFFVAAAAGEAAISATKTISASFFITVPLVVPPAVEQANRN